MQTTESRTLDTTQLLLKALEIGEMINRSAELADYLHWKQAVERDPDVQEAVKDFAKAKESFEDCERFGHFHPDYHAALDKVKKVQERLDSYEAVNRYKQAEDRLDELLHSVSETIAYAVSDTVKVPSNNPLPTSDCGGSCSGGCSSCG